MNSIRIKTKIPGPKSEALMRERQNEVARGPFHATPLFVQSAKGSVIEDVDGNKFLDFGSGIGVTNLGHCDSAVVEAIQSQAKSFLHTSFNVLPYEGYVNLAKKLNQAAPIDGPKKTFLANSGAEAVENAIKIARAYTGRPAVVCFEHAFHGRTYMAMTLTAKHKPYKVDFGPFMGDVYRAPFPYTYRWPSSSDSQTVSDECFKKFEDLVNSQIGATEVAAVIVEPVVGEGGFLTLPKEFALKLRNFCTENKIVLISDEIQSGFGRTGSLFASESMGLRPDLMTLAKGLGGGMPISAVVGKSEMMDAPVEGGIGGTYNGNPVSCAAASAVLDAFAHRNILQNVKVLEKVLNERLMMMKEKFSAIGDVRGLGVMKAIEFVKDRKTKEPDAVLCKKIAQYCYQNGVIILSAGTYGNCIRLLMPLTMSVNELNEGLDVLEAGIENA